MGEIRLTFVQDLSAEIMPSLSDWAQNRQSPLPPATLVRDYVITAFLGDRAVHTQTISGNYQRHRIHALPAGMVCDRLRVTVLATQGTNGPGSWRRGCMPKRSRKDRACYGLYD